MLPKSYYKYIINYPILQTFTPEQKTSAVKMVYFLRKNGTSTFSKNTLEQWFGRNYFYLVRLFCDTNEFYDYENGICKSYWLKPEVETYLNSFTKIETLKYQTFEEREIEEIVDENGRTLKSPPKNAVLREDINGQRKQSTVNISTILYIDYERLKEAIEIIDVALKSQDMSTYNLIFTPKKNRDFQTLKLLLNDLETILLIAKNNFSNQACIPVQYHELGCGRLQGIYLNPQNMVSEVRNYIISNGGQGDGVFDYDMSNCHFTLAYQLYNQMVEKKIKSMNYRSSQGIPFRRVQYQKLKALENYLENKEQVRNAIAVETGINWGSLAKIFIISLLYGKRVGKDMLEASPTLKELKADIDVLVDVITKDQSATKKAIVNAMGKSKEAKRLNKYKKLNHILMGLESYIIDEMAQKYKDNVLLLMYDGFVANVNLWEITQYPQHFEIGEWQFDVKFEMKKLRGN